MNDLPGFINIRNLVIVIIILVILGLAGVSVEDDIVENEEVQENTSYVWTGVVHVWDTYLAGPANYLWNEIFVDILWASFVNNMETLSNGGMPNNFENEEAGDLPTLEELIENPQAS